MVWTQQQQQRQLHRALLLSLLALIVHHHHDVVVSAFAPSSFVPASCPTSRSPTMLLMDDAITRTRSSTLMQNHRGHTAIHRQCREKIQSTSSRPRPRTLLHSSLQSDTESSSDGEGTISSSATQAQTSAMQSLGNKIIMEAALQCGATEPMVNVEWKADRIVVTVDVHKDENYQEEDEEEFDDDGIWLGDSLEEDLEDIEWDEIEEDFDDDEDFVDEDFDPESLGLEPESSEDTVGSGKIDLTLIARTINGLLAEDGEESPKFTIAKLHEIEVTTPEFDNVLRGRKMFENYKGFDVTVEHYEDPKKKKKKKKGKAQKTDTQDMSEEDMNEVEIAEPPKLTVTEGKLVGRDYEKEVTMINVKGRVVKIKNDLIECVRLPKAKREKGVK